MQYHLLVFWNSFSHVQEASKDLYYPSLPANLPITDTSLQRKLLNINEYPESALNAPITDITYMFLKENKTYEEDLQPILIRFTELSSGAKGAYWGKSVDEVGVSIIMIGWDSVQVMSPSSLYH